MGFGVTAYTEFHFYSPALDCDAVRLTMFNKWGHEFFMIVPATGARRFRERRASAFETIEEAIRQGLDPGEVRIA